ncbi:uncharacterized protein H6S33_008659 [Morchella sextelata]|uniref:uncharacterized protein n=1 Tax=Morchella sextelata TaxID=1174677 RepID=UPI001D04FA88|nr:uncharacterized protein H6S33_008659 [Morchella sextelata]KAH0602578.1 hypothetical protein H6S33_008659 [Morchella sextelata]
MAALPSNVHISTHPCLLAKLSQVRSASTTPKETKLLIHEISLLLAADALARVLTAVPSGTTDVTPLGASFDVQTCAPASITLVPVLRSGLGMLEAFETLLPAPVPVHHLGLFREKTTLQPVEYYNNLPTRVATSGDGARPCDIAIILDPVIATGGTAEAAIQTLREWGVKKILVVSVLGSAEGVLRAATEGGGEDVEVVVGAVDSELGGKNGGMIVPGIGDIGDRLFLTIGK